MLIESNNKTLILNFELEREPGEEVHDETSRDWPRKSITKAVGE
jgi:hypothetical protein